MPELTLEQAQTRAEEELAKFTEEDWTNFLIIGAVSLFGVWVMTLPERYPAEEVEEDYDVCALCGYAIDPTEGLVYPGPRTRSELGLQPGEAVCRHCLRERGLRR